MVSSAEIMSLKRIVAKNPKSLAFAWLADLLREASSGDKQKLDEALLTVNNGLEVYSNFLPGRLARGRILLEKGDLAGAKIDFEAVAEHDSFCSSAQKLLLETLGKLGQSPKTEIYEKILVTLEPGAAVASAAKAKPKVESAGVNAALDNLLDEEDSTIDDKEDSDVSDLLLKTFEYIFESGKQEPAPPQSAPPSAAPPPAPPSAPSAPVPDLVPYTPPARKSPPPAPNIDALVKEQLASKVENVPDLTGDINSLLESADALPPVSGALTPPSPPSSPSPKSPPSPPDVDALIKEQLTPKMENLPDLTGDIDSLLASAPAVLATSDTPSHPSPKSPSPPDVDALIKEQLTPKMENLPDLTGDMDSLLASAPDLLGTSDTPSPPSPKSPPNPPDVDALVKEQLTPKMKNLPDLTGDMDSLLAKPVFEEPALEPPLSASYSLPPVSDPSPKSPPSPDVDALIKEQLTPKMENLPDLTGDINSLLESAPSYPEAEPELVPYVPPASKADPALAQKPTLTLAELYMDQGLPKKAVEVYKELLIQDPDNADLKEKLALAETKA